MENWNFMWYACNREDVICYGWGRGNLLDIEMRIEWCFKYSCLKELSHGTLSYLQHITLPLNWRKAEKNSFLK